MGVYVNPGNIGFAEINNPNYVDKTMLIELINQTMGTETKLTCVSRPRRFGKSYAARMLTAYYDCSCDSHPLFDDKLIAKTTLYEAHLNRYNVIYLEITSFVSQARRKGLPLSEVPNLILTALQRDLVSCGFETSSNHELSDTLT